MDHTTQDVLFFFDGHMDAYPIYKTFAARVFAAFPEASLRVQKTQITFFHKHVFACVSFARVKRKAQMPSPFLTITLGLPYPLDSGRVAVRVEPYPGRWTTHFVLGAPQEVDEELMRWVWEAYAFAEAK